MNILLLTPPLTQLNTPYPATTQLKAYLASLGHNVTQADLGIELVERIFTRAFLAPIFTEAFGRERLSQRAKSIAVHKDRYLATVEHVIRFLQGRDDTLAVRIAGRGFLPEGPRFAKTKEETLEWAYGTTGTLERAKHIATLYLEDLTDFIADTVSPRFGLIRYGERLGLSAPTFDALERELNAPEDDPVDRLMTELLHEKIEAARPQLVGFSVPFPGTLYSALRCGKAIRKEFPGTVIAMGGGYVNSELRQLSDPRIFSYTDYLLFDDGELPLASLTEHLEGKRPKAEIIRACYAEHSAVVRTEGYDRHLPFGQLPCPDFEGLHPEKYISMTELTNPMHRLWSDGFWNKMTLAHGCYWGKCAFCDTSLDYIRRYDAPTASAAVDHMERIMAQTGSSGFHFTDEALPPRLLRGIADEIIRRRLTVSFWGNIRFEKSFDEELCDRLAEAGCIAVSGGLEVASDRILKLIGKGVSVESAATAMHYLTGAGIMVHAYLMYGFPTEKRQETIDSLEIVRQLFEEGLLQSAFWHRYTMTVHSDSGQHPERYGARHKNEVVNPFANNGIDHTDPESDLSDPDRIGEALAQATYNYMHGNGYEIPLRNWFRDKTVRTTIPSGKIAGIVERLP